MHLTRVTYVLPSDLRIAFLFAFLLQKHQKPHKNNAKHDAKNLL